MSPLPGTSSKWDRRERYARRAQSAQWLVADAIAAMTPRDVEEVEQGLFVNITTGELYDMGFIRPPRPAECTWRIGSSVAVHGADGRAHFSGTRRCGSIWSCPVCSAVIRPTRAAEIAQAVTAHQEAGGSVVFLTLTLRHNKKDALTGTLDTALDGWRQLVKGRWWNGKTGVKSRYSIEGYIRAVEVTYGDNGWHPHVHVLLFTGRELSDVEVAGLGDDFHDRWAAIAHKKTGKQPSRRHGVDVQRVDEDGRILAQYLGKIQEKPETRWTASAELARADVKQGRGASIAPFQLLDDDSLIPTPQRRRLWAEFVEATHGRRSITWSRGLKDRYEVGEKTDDDILDETEVAPARWIVRREAWDAARRSVGAQRLVEALEAAERERWEQVAELLPGRPAPETELPAEEFPPETT